MLSFFDTLLPNVLPAFSFWRNNFADNATIHNVRQNSHAVLQTNSIGQNLDLTTTSSRRFLRMRAGVGDGVLNFSTYDFTDASIGVDIDMASDNHEGTVEIVSYNRLYHGYYLGFPLDTTYRSGIRMHLADGHIASTSALSELSFTGAFRPYTMNLGRFSGAAAGVLSRHNFQSSAAITSRELRLWQNNTNNSYRVPLVSTALWFGQRAGEVLGSFVGVGVLMPVAGAAVGGYISGYITTHLVSIICPPDQVVDSLNPLQSSIEFRYLEMEGRILLPPTMALSFGGTLTYGNRIARDARLPSFVEAERAHPHTPALPFSAFYNPSIDDMPEEISELEADFRAIPFYEIFDLDVLNQQEPEAVSDGEEEEDEVRRTPTIIFPPSIASPL